MTKTQELRKQILEARQRDHYDRETKSLIKLGEARDRETKALSLEEAYGQPTD